MIYYPMILEGDSLIFQGIRYEAKTYMAIINF